MNRFLRTVESRRLELRRGDVRVLQLNLGRVCDIACRHCHVSAGPNRKESMSADVALRCLEWIRRHHPEVVDLTGGSPELCPSFLELARGAKEAGARVLVRTNLVVLVEAGRESLVGEMRDLGLDVVASLPCYLAENVDAQRGPGVYAKSIEALLRLNAAGFGLGNGRMLDLVYNPSGASLPPDQATLERDYRRELGERYGIRFDHLYCLTNLPIGRFARQLRAAGELESYLSLLEANFNPDTVSALMCRDTISVDYEGAVYDCDFNQMTDLSMGGARRRYLWQIDPEVLAGAAIATAPHCFGCTAGSGSSCGGALVPSVVGAG